MTVTVFQYAESKSRRSIEIKYSTVLGRSKMQPDICRLLSDRNTEKVDQESAKVIWREHNENIYG